MSDRALPDEVIAWNMRLPEEVANFDMLAVVVEASKQPQNKRPLFMSNWVNKFGMRNVMIRRAQVIEFYVMVNDSEAKLRYEIGSLVTRIGRDPDLSCYRKYYREIKALAAAITMDDSESFIDFTDEPRSNTVFISWVGFNQLIMNSTAAGAKAFYRWINEHVIQALMLDGKYVVSEHVAELEAGIKQLSIEKIAVDYDATLIEQQSQERYAALLHADEEIEKTNVALDNAANQRAVIEAMDQKDLGKLVLVRYPPNADGDESHTYRFFIIQGVSEKTVRDFINIANEGSQIVLSMITFIASCIFKRFKALHADIIVYQNSKTVAVADHIDTNLMVRLILGVHSGFISNMKAIEEQEPLVALVFKA